ncbi:MAG: monovalent cation/H(+) antiporter subunit G [Synergistaceae bacterium]|nr:monovalent cation/H(+) antiporter subunit G [Synergistaceae bacterium]
MIEALLVLIVLCVGLISNSLGAFSLYRFPDVYTRIHGATKCTTFGTIFVSCSVFLYAFIRFIVTGEWRFIVLIIHGFIAVLVLLITNATSSHAIARAAWRSGTRPEPCAIDALLENEREIALKSKAAAKEALI